MDTAVYDRVDTESRLIDLATRKAILGDVFGMWPREKFVPHVGSRKHCSQTSVITMGTITNYGAGRYSVNFVRSDRQGSTRYSVNYNTEEGKLERDGAVVSHSNGNKIPNTLAGI